jgi:hypothetical protein
MHGEQEAFSVLIGHVPWVSGWPSRLEPAEVIFQSGSQENSDD